MSYFTQSLNFPLSYGRSQSILDTIGLYSFEQVLEEGIGAKERKDLNKIYEQTDIFVKRNSIVTINNKKQKRLFASSLSLQRSQYNRTQTSFDPTNSLLMIPKQGALFQQIHPSDVQKTPDDNIFDYCLHMKLARSQQIFKVEQMKRKQKKKQPSSGINIKECECCGRQYSRYHKCNHSLCERKCKKARRGESRRDVSSIVYSDSKDQNWSQENFQQQRMRQKSEKKTLRAQNPPHPSSSSNRTNRDGSHPQPPQHLLFCVDKLITERAFNTFSYKFIQIKQDQQQIQPSQSSIVINNIDEFKQLQGGSIININDDDNRSNQLMYQQHQGFRQLINQKRQFGYAKMIEDVNGLGNSDEKELLGRIMMVQGQKDGGVKEVVRDNQDWQVMQQKENLQEVEGEGAQGDNQAQNQQQKQQQSPNQQQNNNQQAQSPTPFKDINIKNTVNNNQPLQSNSSSSSSQQILEQRLQDFPQQPKIQLNQEDKDNLILQDKQDRQQQQQVNQGQSQNIVKQKQAQMLLQQQIINKQKKVQLPDYRPDEQDSLNEEIDEIQQQQEEETSPKPISKLLTQPISKLSKKQSKQLKKIEKQRVQSEQIQEIQPTIEMQQQNLMGQEDGLKENVKEQSKEKSSEKHGRGKGRGMGHGYGIFQEELDIYSESSSLLQEKPNNQQYQNELYQNIDQNPAQSKSLNHLIPQSISSKSLPPGTPRKRVVIMQRIIQQIKLQSQKVEDEKGLGKGKVFGRGMGVVQWGEELQKQMENGDIVLYGGDDDDEVREQGNGRKKVKSAENISKVVEKRIIADEQQQAAAAVANSNIQPAVDKFDQLIIDQSQQQSAPSKLSQQQQKQQQCHHYNSNEQIGEYVQKQCEQAMNYIEYINKRETVVHSRECVARFVQESGGDDGGQQQIELVGENGINCQENVGIIDSSGNQKQQLLSVNRENSIENQINQQDLEQMIDLKDQSYHSMSQKQDLDNSPPQQDIGQ